MATGGAWQSETFETGRDVEKGRGPTQAPPMQQGSGATPPAMYSPSPIMGMRKESGTVGVLAFCLRIGQIVFTLIAFSGMAATKQTIYSSYYDYYYTTYSTSSIKFSSVKAFV
jgi:hypothetical protein